MVKVKTSKKELEKIFEDMCNREKIRRTVELTILNTRLLYDPQIAYQIYGKKKGKRVEDLTEEEMEIAFFDYVLEQIKKGDIIAEYTC